MTVRVLDCIILVDISNAKGVGDKVVGIGSVADRGEGVLTIMMGVGRWGGS